MRSRLGTIALVGWLCVVASACGDDHNDNRGGRTPTPTPGRTSSGSPVATPASGSPTAASPTPATTPAQNACPVRVTYIVNGAGADLDTGWSGIYSDQPQPIGGSLSLALDCPGETLGSCGACAISGPIASTTTIDNRRCANASNVVCTSDGDCPGSTCVFFFGPNVPVSGGGFPICFTNRVAGPVTGTLSPELGAGTTNLPIVASLFSGITVEQPCPVCSGATLESSGTCAGGDRDGMPCTVHGVSALGNVSFDCPASAAGNIGNFDVPLDLTTGTRTIDPSATCTGTSGGACWCVGQERPNACDGGVCTVDAQGEGTCATGPADQVCASERFRSCTTNIDCPASGDGCIVETRQCLGATDASGVPSGAITRTGTPSQATPTLVSAFCLGATSSPSVNTTGGFPGPGALRLPTVVCVAESCPSSPPTAAP